MKKKLPSLLISIVGLLFIASYSFASSPILEGKRIVIDPGHGGDDYGSTACLNYPEKTANLDIAKRLETLLLNDKAEVKMTRTDNDATYSNRHRYETANDFKGEVLVSIHLNGSTDDQVNGTLGLYGKKKKDEAFTTVLHERLLNNLRPIPDHGVTNFASGVLLKSKMPATIQEAVYISNKGECTALRDGDGTRQQEIAEALYSGLVDWFSQTPDGGGDDDSGGGGNGGKPCDNPPCK